MGFSASEGFEAKENPPVSDFSLVVVDDPKEKVVPDVFSSVGCAPKENPPPSFGPLSLVSGGLLAVAPNEKSPPEDPASDLPEASPPNLKVPPLPNAGAGAVFSTDFEIKGETSVFCSALRSGVESFLAPNAKLPNDAAEAPVSDLEPNNGVLTD